MARRSCSKSQKKLYQMINENFYTVSGSKGANITPPLPTYQEGCRGRMPSLLYVADNKYIFGHFSYACITKVQHSEWKIFFSLMHFRLQRMFTAQYPNINANARALYFRPTPNAGFCAIFFKFLADHGTETLGGLSFRLSIFTPPSLL